MAKLRSQLRGVTWFYKGLQIIAGAVLPIGEAVLVNLATQASDPTPYVVLLVFVVVFHLALLVMILLVEAPLPELLTEFDDQARNLQQARARISTLEADYTTYHMAVVAAVYGISRIEAMRRISEKDLKKAFEEVLSPWILYRSQIFLFREGDALYNFAVYLFDSDSGLLKVEYRSQDDRITTSQSQREWGPGDGHVGHCFGQRKTVFSLYTEGEDDAQEIASTSQPRPKDKTYYNSFAATPLMVGEEPKGMFIVTRGCYEL